MSSDMLIHIASRSRRYHGGAKVGVAPRAGPVSEFCVQLDGLRIASGAGVPLLAKRLGLSRAQLYAILGGRITRPPDWDRVVRPLVDTCTRGDPAAVAAWRHRHAIMSRVWEELRRRDRPAGSATLAKRSTGVPRQLPAAVSCFTGRLAELATLTEFLDVDGRSPAVVISAIGGTAGVGKTALAVTWAHQVADRFPGGQLYVNLHGYDPAQPVPATDALAGFLHALGVPGQDIPPEEGDRAARYRSLLADRRVLILLDNAGSAEQVRPLLPGTPTCVTVVTSRNSLPGLVARDGALRLDLDVLPPREAIGLLHALIGGRADAEPDAAAALAAQCCRLPLALRVAAELATAHPRASLADLAGELADQQRRLDLLDAGADPRTAVRAVFSWSYQHLGSDAARAFRLLSLHPGPGLDTYAAAALTHTTPGHAARLLDVLTRAYLLQPATPHRYAMHDLLRAYAREQAAARDTHDSCRLALARLFDYYLAGAAMAMDLCFPAETHLRPRTDPEDKLIPSLPDERAARIWLNTERANLVQAVVHAADNGWPRHATALASTLFRYLIVGGHLPEADTIYRHALHAAKGCEDLAGEAASLTALGIIAMVKGQFHDAIERYLAALDRYCQCGDRAGQGRVLHNLGLTEQRRHDHQSAVSYLLKAITAFERAQDRFSAAVSLSTLSGVEVKLGSLDQASAHLQRALQVFRDENAHDREAEALLWAGDLSLRRGQLAQAAACHEQSLAIHRRYDNPCGIAEELRNLGEVKRRQGEHQQAISCLRQAVELYRRSHDQYGQTLTLRTLARALHEIGQPAPARAELEAALQLATDTGNTYQQASAHRDLAESHCRDGQDEQARYHWQQALTLYTQLGAPEADQICGQLTAAPDA
jgi:tetratricopeptide (TPR) repeat protein